MVRRLSLQFLASIRVGLFSGLVHSGCTGVCDGTGHVSDVGDVVVGLVGPGCCKCFHGGSYRVGVVVGAHIWGVGGGVSGIARVGRRGGWWEEVSEECLSSLWWCDTGCVVGGSSGSGCLLFVWVRDAVCRRSCRRGVDGSVHACGCFACGAIAGGC